MPKKIKPVRQLVCIHEAGHAVAAVALNVGIERVSVHLDHSLMKGVCWTTPVSPEVNRCDEVQNAIDAAGEVAVELFQRGGSKEIDRYLGAGSLERARAAFNNVGLTFSPVRDLPKSDNEKLASIVDRQTPEQRREYYVDLCIRVIDLLTPLLKAVEWVADELYQFGEVGGYRVVEVVAACRRNALGALRTAG